MSSAHVHVGVGHRGPPRQDVRPDQRQRPRRGPDEDPYGRVACETLVTTGLCVVAGEISTKAHIDIPRLARDTISGIGYTDAAFGIDGKTCGVIISIDEQSPDIAMGVDKAVEQRAGTGDPYDEVGAGDQGMMFGYACDETDDLMPMPIWLAHRLAAPARRGAQGRRRRLPPPRRQDPGVGRVRGRRARCASTPCSSPRSTRPGVDIDDDIRSPPSSST